MSEENQKELIIQISDVETNSISRSIEEAKELRCPGLFSKNSQERLLNLQENIFNWFILN